MHGLGAEAIIGEFSAITSLADLLPGSR